MSHKEMPDVCPITCIELGALLESIPDFGYPIQQLSSVAVSRGYDTCFGERLVMGYANL